MFTGIITDVGTVRSVEQRGDLRARIATSYDTGRIDIGASIACDGVCLTVVAIEGTTYTVTAVAETLSRSNLGDLREGDRVNLERAMVLGARLDGHIVQGHVDQVGRCTGVSQQDGSWIFRFDYEPGPGRVTIEKGSITVDGVSLTVVDSAPGSFSVAIIPYTYEHTRFCEYAPGTRVNLEFDMIGKYVARLMEPHRPQA